MSSDTGNNPWAMWLLLKQELGQVGALVSKLRDSADLDELHETVEALVQWLDQAKPEQGDCAKYRAALVQIGATKEYEFNGSKKVLCLACGWDVEMCDKNCELGAVCSGKIARAAVK